VFPCPCCGMESLEVAPPGTYEICNVCSWEDDDVQFHDPDFRGGANQKSLRQAQSEWLRSVNAATAARTGWVEVFGRRYRRSPAWHSLKPLE